MTKSEVFDPSVSAYLALIQSWRDSLHDIATGILQMQGIEERERDNLKRALTSLYSIDELVKIIGEHPSTHVQAHGYHNLWGVLGAAFIIGSRGIENPLTQKILKDKSTKRVAGARSAKPRIKERDQINAVVARHCANRWAENPKRKKTKSGTAKDILEGVNADLVKLRIEPLKHDGLLKRINF